MDSPLIGLTAILVLGAAAQLLASFVRLPSILLLIVVGFLIGPEVAGVVDPDALLGNLLIPVVSLSIAVLLFEGGLSLRFSELGEHGPVVLRLVTLGAGVTWVGAALAAWLLLDFSPAIAILLGAVLTVTGPTVVLPLLRQIRPTGAASSILKWEGILIDPVGAVLAVLVFEAIVGESASAAAWGSLLGIAKTLVIGGGLGLLAGWLLALLLRRYWIPDHLHSAVALGMALCAFVLANSVQHESGLLTVTFMGVYLANQKRVSVRHILEFKENIRVLLISALFIILTARLRLADFERLDLAAVGFLAVLILVVRPLCVWASTRGASLSRRDQLFMASMAPRGIVAASVAAIFALRLGAREGAADLMPVTFFVIAGTVLLYGLGAGPLARKLGLAVAKPQGFLLVGAHEWGRALATALQEHGLRVLLVDTNPNRIAKARMAGLPAYHGNALAESADEKLDLQGIGRLLALTRNDEVNSLCAIHYQHLFGRREVYQLAPLLDRPGKREDISPHLRGRQLFGEEFNDGELAARFAHGARVKSTRLTEQFDFAAWRARHGEAAIPLLTIDDDGDVTIATVDQPLEPGPNHTLLALVDEEPKA